MIHPNARLTPLARAEMVAEVEAGWPQAEVARRFRVSRATVAKWVSRCRSEGVAGVQDRSSRPRRSPRLTPLDLASQIEELRRSKGMGPHAIAWELGTARSTVYAVLRRAGLHRLAWLHRTTREIVRYERARPGELVHCDIKKLGRIPPGGGKRFAPGFFETHSGPRHVRGLGFDYIHMAVDDHSRYAYAEALPDERGVTTADFLERALSHFTACGVVVERILTDNGKNYTSGAFREAAAAHGIRLKRTRLYRPQTNGKAEAFNKILQAEWAHCLNKSVTQRRWLPQ